MGRERERDSESDRDRHVPTHTPNTFFFPPTKGHSHRSPAAQAAVWRAGGGHANALDGPDGGSLGGAPKKAREAIARRSSRGIRTLEPLGWTGGVRSRYRGREGRSRGAARPLGRRRHRLRLWWAPHRAPPQGKGPSKNGRPCSPKGGVKRSAKQEPHEARARRAYTRARCPDKPRARMRPVLRTAGEAPPSVNRLHDEVWGPKQRARGGRRG